MSEETNGHSLPIQWKSELVAYAQGEYVVLALYGRHPDRLMPDVWPLRYLDPEEARALALQLQQLAQQVQGESS